MTHQACLFQHPEASEQIKGLAYIPEYISKEEESQLIGTIDSKPWLADLKRRVQHYGWKYDYKARNTHQDLYIGDLQIGWPPMQRVYRGITYPQCS